MHKTRLTRREAGMSRKRDRKRDWCVTMRCIVTKVYYCDDCTEEQARENPLGHSRCSEEIDLADWQVQKVEEND